MAVPHGLCGSETYTLNTTTCSRILSEWYEAFKVNFIVTRRGRVENSAIKRALEFTV